jgi:cytochrome c oxidase subunit 3
MRIIHGRNSSQPLARRSAAATFQAARAGGQSASTSLICQTRLVATVTTAPPAYNHAPANRPNMVAVGTIVWLSSELMFFAGLFAMYFTLRAVNPGLWAEETSLLNVTFSSINTTILVLSSVTCQLGVFAAERGDVKGLRRWFIITFLMGSFFIGGQVMEYTELVREGLTLSSNAYGSVFYLTTGFHGMHVTGGLIAFLFVLATTYVAKRFTHDQATRAIVVSYYWHFVDVVWIALFFMIYILK